MTAFDHEPLWNKSKIFIERGLRERHAGEFGSFHLWAAISLEVLGKAALAKIHPSLVADPTSQESMFAACGLVLGTKRKSIQAKTVFERLGRISKDFDKVAHDFCEQLTHDRNAELHSGELPFATSRPERWVPQFWKVAKVILEAQSRTLTDWVGAEEAELAQEVIDQAITVLEQTVRGRIRKNQEEFNKKYPLGSRERSMVEAQHKGGGLVLWRDFAPHYGDETVPSLCPACGCDGLLNGTETYEEVVDQVQDAEYWNDIVEVTYSPEAFRCRACGLKLDGQEELHVAEMPSEFRQRKVRQTEFDDDAYGND